MIDRGRSRGWTNKIKSRLSIVDRGGSWCWPYKVKSSLGIVVWGWSRSSNNSLLLSQPVQLVLCIVTTGSRKRSYRWSNVCKLSVLECLPFWGSYDRNMLSSREGNTGQRYNLGEHTEWYDHFCYQTGEYSPC